MAKANATEPQVEVFDQMTQVLGKMTKGKRLLTCILLYNAFVTQAQAEDDYDAPVTFQANEAAAALVVLVGCVRLAGLVTSTPPVRTTPARATPGHTSARALAGMRKCAHDKPGVPGTLEASDGSWTLTVDGDLKQTSNKLKVACRTKSGKTVLKIRAAKKGVPLRKVAGKRPVVAVYNSPDAEETVPVKVTFSLP